MATAKSAAGAKQLPPIVIKRIKKGSHGHHGGVWKIAYADFVTAMMAFFLLMWVLGSTTTGDLAGIAAYFQNPLRISIQGGQGSGDATRPIKGGGENLFRTSGQEARADSLSNQRRVSDSESNDPQAQLEKQKLESAKEAIEEQVNADPMLQQLKNQVFIAVGPDGLRIQIVDDKNRPMFAIGSAEPLPYTRRLLRTIGRVLSDLTNRVRIEGHTDNRQFGNGAAGYGNWELSSERANAARRELVQGGMDGKRTAQVSGYADSMRLNPDDASDPVNRRISITVLRNKPQESSAAKSAVKGLNDKAAHPAQSSATTMQKPQSLDAEDGPRRDAQPKIEGSPLPGVPGAPEKPPIPPQLPMVRPVEVPPPGPPAAPTARPVSPSSAFNSMLYQLPQRPVPTLPGSKTP